MFCEPQSNTRASFRCVPFCFHLKLVHSSSHLPSVGKVPPWTRNWLCWSCSGTAWPAAPPCCLSGECARRDRPPHCCQRAELCLTLPQHSPHHRSLPHLPGSQSTETSRNLINLQTVCTSFSGDCTWPTCHEVIRKGGEEI